MCNIFHFGRNDVVISSLNRTLIEYLQSQESASTKELSEISQRVETAEAETRSLSTERDDLLAANDTLKQQVETFQKNDSDYRTLIEDLQSQLVAISQRIESAEAEKILRLKDMDDRLAEIDTLKQTIQISENSIFELQAQLAGKKKEGEDMVTELQKAKVIASKERAEFLSKIASLETDLLRSENEEKRLGSAMVGLTNIHANTMARLQDIKSGLANQKDLLNQISEMEQRMHTMTSEVEQLNTQLIDSKTMAREECRRLKVFIAIHESDLLQSRQNADSLRIELKAAQKSLDDTAVKMHTLLAEQEMMRKEITTLNSSVHGMRKENENFSHPGHKMPGELNTENGNMMSGREPHAARAALTLNNLRGLTEASSLLQIIEEMKMNFRSLQACSYMKHGIF